MKRVFRDSAIAMITGLVALWIVVLVTLAPFRFTANPFAASTGFPFTYSYANPPSCGNINPGNGCGYSYDSVMVVLDYLFWVGVAFAIVSAFDLTRTGFASMLGNNAKGKTCHAPTGNLEASYHRVAKLSDGLLWVLFHAHPKLVTV